MKKLTFFGNALRSAWGALWSIQAKTLWAATAVWYILYLMLGLYAPLAVVPAIILTLAQIFVSLVLLKTALSSIRGNTYSIKQEIQSIFSVSVLKKFLVSVLGIVALSIVPYVLILFSFPSVGQTMNTLQMLALIVGLLGFVYITIAYYLLPFVVVDPQHGGRVIKIFKRARHLSKRHFVTFFVSFVFIIVINFLGYFIPYELGYLVTIPFSYLIMAHFYKVIS